MTRVFYNKNVFLKAMCLIKCPPFSDKCVSPVYFITTIIKIQDRYYFLEQDYCIIKFRRIISNGYFILL